MDTKNSPSKHSEHSKPHPQGNDKKKPRKGSHSESDSNEASPIKKPKTNPHPGETPKNKDDFIADNFVLINKSGQGAFGVIYLAFSLRDNMEVAVKKEWKRVGKASQLKTEAKIYQNLLNISPGKETSGAVSLPQNTVLGVPKFYGVGELADSYYLISEFLGPNWIELFNFCRASKFTISTVCLLALQMLNRVETLHQHNYLHRDIKPENFWIGTEDKSNVIFWIDFGLSKRYKNPKTNQHIPYRESRQLTGTARYVSINTHWGIDQSRRDDWESWGYVLIYFLKGSLPWQGIKVNGGDKYVRIMEKKLQIPSELLCIGLPDECAQYLNYCKTWKFEDRPDYDFWRGLFIHLLGQCVSWYGLNKEDFKFDWCFEDPATSIWQVYKRKKQGNSQQPSCNKENENCQIELKYGSWIGSQKEIQGLVDKNSSMNLQKMKDFQLNVKNENDKLLSKTEDIPAKNNNTLFQQTNENNPDYSDSSSSGSSRQEKGKNKSKKKEKNEKEEKRLEEIVESKTEEITLRNQRSLGRNEGVDGKEKFDCEGRKKGEPSLDGNDNENNGNEDGNGNGNEDNDNGNEDGSQNHQTKDDGGFESDNTITEENQRIGDKIKTDFPYTNPVNEEIDKYINSWINKIKCKKRDDPKEEIEKKACLRENNKPWTNENEKERSKHSADANNEDNKDGSFKKNANTDNEHSEIKDTLPNPKTKETTTNKHQKNSKQDITQSNIIGKPNEKLKDSLEINIKTQSIAWTNPQSQLHEIKKHDSSKDNISNPGQTGDTKPGDRGQDDSGSGCSDNEKNATVLNTMKNTCIEPNSQDIASIKPKTPKPNKHQPRPTFIKTASLCNPDVDPQK